MTPSATQDLPRLHQLVTLSECKNTPDTLDAYVATILLRELSDRAGFHGIIYPTVHGPFRTDPQALNVVITSAVAIDAVVGSAVGDPTYVAL